MFWKMWTIENTKTFRRSLLWIEMGLLAALVAGLNLLLFALYQANPGGEMPVDDMEQFKMMLTWPASLLATLDFAGGNSLGGLLVIILTGALTAQEYAWRTLHLWLSRGLPRPTLLSAKFAALLAPVLLIALTPLVAGGLLTAVFSIHLNGSLQLEQLNAWQVLWSVLRTAYTLLPYAGMAFLLAVLTRSAVAAIGIGVAYSLLIEGIALQIMFMFANGIGKFMAYLPGGLAQGLLQLNQGILAGAQITVNGDSGPVLPTLEPVPAAIGIAAWTLLFVGLALWAFQRQDLAE